SSCDSRSGWWRASRAKAPPSIIASTVPSSQLNAVTPPDLGRVAGNRKKPEPIMLLATTKVASTGPILRGTLALMRRSWKGKLERPAHGRPRSGGGSAALAQLAVAVAVGEIDHLPKHGPADEDLPVLRERLLEQEQAGEEAQRADQPEERHAERTRQFRTLVAQHEHAQADG